MGARSTYPDPTHKEEVVPVVLACPVCKPLSYSMEETPTLTIVPRIVKFEDINVSL